MLWIAGWLWSQCKGNWPHLKLILGTQSNFAFLGWHQCSSGLFATWTVAHQAPLSMGFSRQEYRSGLPFPTPGDLPDLGIEPMSHCVSSIGRWVLYHYCHLRYPDFTQILLVFSKNRNFDPSSVSSSWECVMSLQSCLTLRNPVDCSPPGSSVHRILQARILEWVTVPSSRGSSWE